MTKFHIYPKTFVALYGLAINEAIVEIHKNFVIVQEFICNNFFRVLERRFLTLNS